jgi:hypothetical protein
MEQAFVYTTIIDRAGGQFHFQIRLPHDTKRIIGIETGVSIRNGLPDFPVNVTERFRAERNVLIGRLKMQSLNNADFFFAKDIVERDNSVRKAEIAYIPINPGSKIDPPNFVVPIVNGWDAYRWIHTARNEEDNMLLTSSNVIRCFYRDIVGKQFSLQPDYTLKIYIWYEN